MFLKALHYDLRSVERVFTVAIASIGVMALGVVGLYFVRAISETKNRDPETVAKRDPRDPGVAAQQGVQFLLYTIPLVLAAAGTFFLADLIVYGTPAAETLARYAATETCKAMSGAEVLDVYSASALRLIPFLGFMFGPLTIIVDVIGDVVFFLAADRFSIQEEAVARVRYGLLAPCSDGTTVILCHSQGSILVRQALASFPRSSFKLITVGSPLSSIYSRFLGWSLQGTMPPGCTWVNAFRTGDYIGGNIEAASPNIALGNGGHTDYWSDERVWLLLDEG